MSNNQIDTSSGLKCFVLMGFGVKTDYTTGRTLDLEKSYQLLIKPVVEAKGFVCFRADEIRRSGAIDVPAYHELLTADVVIVDLSTADPNALYGLGIRHALRPHGTIVISEMKVPYPFDLNHVTIITYTHPDEAINEAHDYEEIMRFRAVLGETLDQVLCDQRADSPVYTFLQQLRPPSLGLQGVQVASWTGQDLGQEGQAIDAVPLNVPTSKSGTKDPTLATLIEQGERAIKEGQFSTAKTFFTAAQQLFTGGPDTYLIQRLVLATYKAQEPTRSEALLKGRRLLEDLSPKNSNDPQTLHLLGNIEFALFEEGKDVNRLVRARQAYERLYMIQRDYHNGITLAYVVALHAEYRKDNAEKLADIVFANRLRREVVEQGKAKLAEIDTIRSIESRLSRTSKTAEAAEKKFWVWSAIAEAYYGLGDTENYHEALNEAALIHGATWLMEAMIPQIERLNPLLRTQADLLSAADRYLGIRSDSAIRASSALPKEGEVKEVESSVTRESQPDRDVVFFSYSHKDVAWLDEIQKTLTPSFRNRHISLWDDRQIKPGQEWREAIKDALSKSRGAILLISRDFLASKFIADHELPDLLRDAGEDGVILMWVAIEESLYDDAEFEKYQCLNNPAMPLASLDHKKLGPEIVSICKKIRDRIFPR